MNNNYNYELYKQNPNMISQLPEEKQAIFAENILSNNIGKYLKIYMSFSDSVKWCDKIFEGYLENIGRDFILVFDKNNNHHYLLWNLYIDYIEFNEQLNI